MNKNAKVEKPWRQVTRPARPQPLTLQITIPGKAVPLFRALMEVTQARNAAAFASTAVCRWIKSDEAIQKFDDVLNEQL